MMNVVREINKINELELDLGTTAASWHDDYKDSAYVYVGGLHNDLTEGDIITIFSQYGEVMNVNIPRDKETGKTKGFGFLMYEDQRSTVLAVDNLNGAKVLEKTLRVDHVKSYKQPKEKGEDGEMFEREEQNLNAKPELIMEDGQSESSISTPPSIDPEDPMRDYLLTKRKEERALKKSKKLRSESKHTKGSPEERRARKERKKLNKASREVGSKSVRLHEVEQLLGGSGRRGNGDDDTRPQFRPSENWRDLRKARSRSRSPYSADRSSRHRDDNPSEPHGGHHELNARYSNQYTL